MAKRSQTTGLPKTRKSKSSDASGEQSAAASKSKGGVKRQYRSRAEREATLQRRIILGTAITAVVLIVLLIVAIGFEQFIRPNQVVATVNGKDIFVSDYEKRIQMERAAINFQIVNQYAAAIANGATNEILNSIFSQEPYSTWLREAQVKEQLGSRVINEMVNDELILEELNARGISITEEDIQEEINKFFNFDPEALTGGDEDGEEAVDPTATPTPFVSPTPSPEPTPTPQPTADAEADDESEGENVDGPTAIPTTAISTPVPEPTLSVEERLANFNDTVENFYQSVLEDTDLTRADIDAYFEILARRTALQKVVTEDASNQEMYVNARHILVENEGDAQDVIDALANGESFAALAQAISTDTGSGARGGELGWAPVRNYVEPFADAVRDAEIGSIVGPVQTQFGYHVIQVTAREEREMSDAQFEAEKAQMFQEWLQELRDEQTDHIEITDRWLSNIPTRPQLVLPGQ
ncbi:MAG: hypothetical protein D6737_12570 [Chloroflexi bacterium]|nr:MAG: hypothetical protein CUN54_06880 [Phototrophicales bacterium]RMF79121.1 MAG: hypothetical protein D6737_12570 [Chloroflexota bacterium]